MWPKKCLDKLSHYNLPEAMRREIAQDVPRWSEFIQQEAERFSYPYVDTVTGFPDRLQEAEALLTTGI